MTISGILLDIGDTLLPATAYRDTTLAQLARWLEANHIVPSATEFVVAYRRADVDPTVSDLPDLNHLYGDQRIIRSALGAMGARTPQARVDTILQEYRKILRSIILQDSQLKSTLRELITLNVRLGIVSNGTTAEQTEQLSLLGIHDFFAPIIISQQVGFRKPDPRIFELALEPWKFPPASVLFVGDRPDWDVEAPRRAGMRAALTIQFVNHATGATEIQPDFVIRELGELLDIVRRENEH